MIHFGCPSCGKKFQVKDEFVGRRTKCPDCGQSIQVPPATTTKIPSAGAEFDDLIGQDHLKAIIVSKRAFSKAKKCPLPHLLFCGPPQSGKETFATLISHALGTNIQNISAKGMKGSGDLLPYLTNAGEGSLLLLKDIDSLGDDIIDFLLPVLNDYRVDIVLGDGINARIISLPLKHFTIVGTTSKPSRVDKRLLPWVASLDFMPYTPDEFEMIIGRMLSNAELHVSGDVPKVIARLCNDSLEKASIIVKKLKISLGNGNASNIPVNKPLSLETLKEILEWMGYKTDSPLVDRASVICSMSGTEFEEHVASVFKGLGFAVEYTPVTGDHGIDLMLRKGTENAVVQCKRWEGVVGEPVIRDFLGSMIGVGVKIGYMVTTGRFTAQAIEFGEKNGVQMIDLDALLFMANQPSTEKNRNTQSRP